MSVMCSLCGGASRQIGNKLPLRPDSGDYKLTTCRMHDVAAPIIKFSGVRHVWLVLRWGDAGSNARVCADSDA